MIAVGTDLAFAAITKTVGAYQHTRHGTIDSRLLGRLAIGSVPGALLGTQLVNTLAATHAATVDGVLTHVLGVALIVAARASLFCAIGLPWLKVTRPDRCPVYGLGVGSVRTSQAGRCEWALPPCWQFWPAPAVSLATEGARHLARGMCRRYSL